MTSQAQPGDVHVSTITLHSINGPVNITDIVVELSVLESLFHPSVVGEMLVLDAKDIIESLPILGEEKVTVEFEAPDRESAKFELMVAEIDEFNLEDSFRGRTFRIKLVSEETYYNMVRRVMKAYNTNVSSMIQDVVKTELKSTKKVDAQDTKGVQKIVVPNIKPYDAIDMMRRRAVSSSDKPSMFLFYETKDGFSFKTLENLLQQTDVGDRRFSLSPDFAAVDARQSKFREIISFDFPRTFSSPEKLMSGGLNHGVRTLDLATLSYKDTENRIDPTTYSAADGKLKRTNSQQFVDKFGDKPGAWSFIPVDSSNPASFIPETTPHQQAAASALFNTQINLHVMGDSELTVGKMIELDIKTNDVSTNDGKSSKLMSGNFLVTQLRHIVHPRGGETSYTCSIEAIKGGATEDRDKV